MHGHGFLPIDLKNRNVDDKCHWLQFVLVTVLIKYLYNIECAVPSCDL